MNFLRFAVGRFCALCFTLYDIINRLLLLGRGFFFFLIFLLFLGRGMGACPTKLGKLDDVCAKKANGEKEKGAKQTPYGCD